MSSSAILSTPEFARPTISHGRGVTLVDEVGKQYLDGSSGAMTASLGHGHADIVGAMTQQAAQVAFTYRTQFANRPAEDLAFRIAHLAPGDLNKTFFVNSGSEATEFAVRTALSYWQQKGKPSKVKILGRDTSYHGMTLGAMSVSGHPNRRGDYGDILHDFATLPRVYPYRDSFTRESTVDYGQRIATEVEQSLLNTDTDTIAALIIEPIVGAAGGVLVPPPGYLSRIREVCDRFGVLLIADEVVTGFGRTGRWFACDHENVVPDILTYGKGISAGYSPVAGVLLRDSIVEVLSRPPSRIPFGHTFSANPLGASTCLAVIDVIENNNLLENVKQRGAQLERGLRSLAAQHPAIVDIRGRGLLWGLEFEADTEESVKGVKHQNSVAQTFADICFRLGLVIYPAGIAPLDNSAIISPPFIITEDEIDQLLGILKEAMIVLAIECLHRPCARAPTTEIAR